MKKLLLGLSAVLLLGAGCSGSDSGDLTRNSDGSPYVPVAQIPAKLGPQPAYPGDNPDISVQGVWAGFVLAIADNKNCDEAKLYLMPALQPSFTADACKQMSDYIMNVPSIDWSKTVTSADKKKVTLYSYEGELFADYLLGTDGAWYLNTPVWVAKL
ncbi:MAG: hypothetical protein WC813_04140 [Patescibacteria group bacterium]